MKPVMSAVTERSGIQNPSFHKTTIKPKFAMCSLEFLLYYVGRRHIIV